MTCGNDVFDKKQQSRIAQRLHEQLVAEGKDQISAAEVKKALEKEEQQRKAEEFKNRLLDFDRTSAQRTRVIGLGPPSLFLFFSSSLSLWCPPLIPNLRCDFQMTRRTTFPVRPIPGSQRKRRKP